MMMKSKNILLCISLFCANLVFANENVIYEQESVKTYTLPLQQALNNDILLSNIRNGNIKAVETNSVGVVHRENIDSADMIRSNNLLIIGKNIGNNHIKTHNELLDAIRANLLNEPSVDLQKIDFLLNLLKIKEEGVKWKLLNF